MSIEKISNSEVTTTSQNEKVSDYQTDKKVYIIDSAKADLKQLAQQHENKEISPEAINYEIGRIARLLYIEGKEEQSKKIKNLLLDEENGYKNLSESANEIADTIEPTQSNNENGEFIKNRNTYILDETKNDLGVLYAKFTKAEHMQHFGSDAGLNTVKVEVIRIAKELSLVVNSDESKDLNKTLEALNKCGETEDEEEIKKLLLEAIHSF